MTSRDIALKILSETGNLPDDRIDLGEAALALATLSTPDVNSAPRPFVAFESYRRHLAEIAATMSDVSNTHGRSDASLADRVDILRAVLVQNYSYAGDTETYEDLQNANLMRVIDRRRGLPVALGILYLHAARSQGWDMVGLNFPGHFLVRLSLESDRVILDPFNNCAEMSIASLRALLKQTAGQDAELSPALYAPVRNRDVLLRLQNNLKLRHWREQRFDEAAEIVDHMLLFAPAEPSLWREKGLLNAHIGNLSAAIRAFETFIAMAVKLGAAAELIRETTALVANLRRQVN